MSSYEVMTGKSIQQSFEAYHKLNPKVYEGIKRLAFQAINKKKNKISFKLITNVLRWEVYLQTNEPQPVRVDGGEAVTFKINDAYHSRYARLFADEYPEHSKKIDFRQLRC